MRYLILLMVLLASSVAYGDRTVLGVTGTAVAAGLGLTTVELGYALSAASLPYLMMQVPSGMLLDRFGSRWIYGGALVLLSVATIMQGVSGLLAGSTAALVLLFAMRFCSGICSSPIMLANARIIANWFPTGERGLASAIFNTAQYLALIVFAPLSAWVVQVLSWPSAFYMLGALSLCVAAVFPLVVRSPLRHPLIGVAELAYIEQGGGLVHIETTPSPRAAGTFFQRVAFQRPLIGLYFFQYCIGVVSSFFMTWFPIYLVKHNGLSIWHAGIGTAVPALFGLAGGIAGGVLSDFTLRRGGSLTLARGLPVFIGFSTALTVVVANHAVAPIWVIGLMSVAFFGKGVAALGWTMISDIAPKNVIGATSGIFNTVGATSGVLTPVVMGHIVDATGSFDWAIIYIASHCLLGMATFALLIRRIERVEFGSSVRQFEAD